MQYLVTGSTGFIGRQLMKKLEMIQADIRLISRKPVPNYESVICNLGDNDIPKTALDGVDIIFHLAGLAHDLQSNPSARAALYHSVNVDATVKLAQLAANKGVEHFVFVSSTKAGGSAIPGQCLTEKDQGEPEGVYGKTKREAELKLIEIGRISGMHISIIRPALVYGPGVKGNLRLMLKGVKQGWFPPIPETGNNRSMIHVDDLVNALFFIQRKNRGTDIFIATDQVNYSSRDIYDAMCKATGRNEPCWSVPKVIFDIASLCSNQIKNKINKLLGDEMFSSAKLWNIIDIKPERTLFDALPEMVNTMRKER